MARTSAAASNGGGGAASGAPAPDARDLESTWLYLENGITHIMTRLSEGLSYASYMNLYTVAYNYCTSSSMTSGGGSGGSRENFGPSRNGALLMGAELYRHLNEYFVSHLTNVRLAAEELSDEPLLNYYTKEWTRYTTGAQYVDRLLQYLNRHWVKREKDEGKKNIYPVYTLALVQWRKVFYEQVQSNNKLSTAVLRQIEKERSGNVIETQLVKNVIDSLVALGLDETDAKRQNLDVYRSAFEVPFIAATELYYRAESEQFIADNSVTEYMKKAEARLSEEDRRVESYLHHNTKKALITKCEDVLVKSHAVLMQEEFQRLLDQDREDDLHRMYALLARIPGGLDPLRDRFEAHVRKSGQDNVQKNVGDGETLDPKVYVEALLTVHKKNAELVSSAFKGEPGFVASLDKACREFVNRNAACPTASRSPELLAKYADAILRKSNKASEDADLERAMNDTMTVFKYIEDKDVFQKFYSKNLAKRLISQLSASDDAESNMITKLKDACGYEYTSKLSRMFQDMTINKDLNDEFRERMRQTHDEAELDVDFHVLVLGTSSWPLTQPNTELKMPKELIKTRERFERFYEHKHNGRQLKWLWQHSRNELRTTFTKQKYILMTSTYQACILLQFNAGSDSLSFQDIQLGTGMGEDVLKPQLALLVKQHVLEHKDELYELNLGFKSKKIKVNLNLQVKSESKAESADVMKHVDEDRKLLIQAIIVRIMKSRKSLKHQTLVQETVSQLSSRFNPRVQDVKKAIDTLLDKEYLERAKDSRDTYNYLA